MNKTVGIVAKILFAVILAFVLLLLWILEDDGSFLRPFPAPEPEYAVTLVQGNPAPYVSVLSYAEDNECADNPIVLDVRADDDPSLALLPRLGLDDWIDTKDWFGFERLDTYGCSQANPGEKYWDLHAVEVKCGPAVLQPQVLHMDGVPVTEFGVLMLLNWPGADAFPYTVDPGYAQSGVAGFTENGSIGWGFGSESHIGPDGGPYKVWASSDPIGWPDRIVGSDALGDVGWFDNHCVPNPMFRVARKQGIISTPGEGYELVDYDEDGNEIGHIPFLVDSPPSDNRKLGLRLDGVDIGYIEWATD